MSSSIQDGKNEWRRREQEHNLAAFWVSAISREEIKNALSILEGRTPDELNILLRHHSERPVRGIEIREREDVDSFLGLCGHLTVATITGFVPPVQKWEGPIVSRIGGILAKEAVLRYYQLHYPLLLPSLLKESFNNADLLPLDETIDGMGAFQWFWRFTTRFVNDENLWYFLSLLDGFSYGELNISSFANFLRDPQQALAGSQKAASERTTSEICVLGLLRFLEFSSELGQALRKMDDLPLTRSAIWYHYAYWYMEFEDVRLHTNKFLGTMHSWMDSANTGSRFRIEADANVENARVSLKELTSGRYSEDLLAIIEKRSKDSYAKRFQRYWPAVYRR